MGFIKNLTMPSGVSLQNAYCRIEKIIGDKSSMSIQLAYYINQIAIEQKLVSAYTEFYQFVPSIEDSSPNIFKQSYNYLKTLPEFSNAIEV
ncbi:hypothetical protein H7B90_23560 [Cohnella xylanilytica]|uniref:Uncharacterized protein n=1 Tax=Cohnella xylanilytica TaxID=557555 RepID=A0A841U5M6_9BACL|nr:hypothetical protein [Cohnella xylanilytica]MBB6694378.1 hypothetical protein [Cohnella xylanilytica]